MHEIGLSRGEKKSKAKGIREYFASGGGCKGAQWRQVGSYCTQQVTTASAPAVDAPSFLALGYAMH